MQVCKITLFSCLLFVAGCKKDDTATEIPLVQIINQTAGNYTCLKYSYYLDASHPITRFDSVYNVPLLIEKASDSTLRVGDKELLFYDTWNNDYIFLKRADPGRIWALHISKQFDLIRYS